MTLNEETLLSAVRSMRRDSEVSRAATSIVVNPLFDPMVVRAKRRSQFRRKQDSFRRWLARAVLGRWIPREVLENHPRLLQRFCAGEADLSSNMHRLHLPVSRKAT